MKKIAQKTRAFTLIELLIVVALIGILASAILISLSAARTKSYINSYKSEVAQAVSSLTLKCDSGVLSAASFPATENHTAGVVVAGDQASVCGGITTATGQFTVTTTPVRASMSVANCTATIRPSGVTYAGAC